MKVRKATLAALAAPVVDDPPAVVLDPVLLLALLPHPASTATAVIALSSMRARLLLRIGESPSS
jgi:hypothetical protein